ncbi:LysR family transcriptional regulator [Aminobacter sp. BE322]|uniref:LysR family transcriptional regulator n=1 Tax=unclassified Aminobacter TaxID=2644704 RepID=UPI003D25FB3A
MDTSLLQCFLTVADTQSFSAAAQRLNITQSTVSHKIARLEDLLGKQLFDRTTRTCALTADGRDLIDHATRVVRSVDDLEQNFKPGLLTGTLVVGVPDDHYLFVPLTAALKDFMLEKPRVGVEIRGGLSSDLTRDLRERNIDLAVIRDVPGASGNDVLCTENLVWITSTNWVPPSDGVVPLALVRGSCAYRKAAISTLDSNGVPWKCMVTCTSLQGVFAVVREGLAVSVVTEGDVGLGVRAAPRNGLLPRLPTSSLTIKYSEKEPTLAARALARTMADVLTGMASAK